MSQFVIIPISLRDPALSRNCLFGVSRKLQSDSSSEWNHHIPRLGRTSKRLLPLPSGELWGQSARAAHHGTQA